MPQRALQVKIQDQGSSRPGLSGDQFPSKFIFERDPAKRTRATRYPKQCRSGLRRFDERLRTRPAMRPFSRREDGSLRCVDNGSATKRSVHQPRLGRCARNKRPPRLFNSFVYLYNICTALGQDHCADALFASRQPRRPAACDLRLVIISRRLLHERCRDCCLASEAKRLRARPG